MFGPRPEFDAGVAVLVGLILGGMAVFLAALNRRLLIDTSDPEIDAATARWLEAKRIPADVRSLVLDDDRAVVFVRADREVAGSYGLGEALKAHLGDSAGKKIDAVYWKFRNAARLAARRSHASHATAATTTTSTGSAAAFIRSHPAVDTSAPEASDETPIVVNTMKSLAPWVFDFSAGS